MNVLITGMSGMLGVEICKIFDSFSSYNLFGICRNNVASIGNVNQINVDITDKINFGKVLTGINPEIVIHTAAVVDVDKCESEKEYADDLHANFLEILHTYSPNAYVIYISSDSVFDGNNGDYYENSIVGPLNYYAYSKTLGEDKLQNLFNKSLIVRTNIYGFHNPPKPSLVEWALSKFEKGENIGGFFDVFFNPIYTKHLAEILLKFCKNNITGIINVGSDEYISKFDFLILLAELFQIDKALIERKSVRSINFNAQRPLNTTLNLSLLNEKLGYLPSLKSDLIKLKKDYCVEFNKLYFHEND